MKIVRGKELNPEVDYEDLDEGETFTSPGSEQLQIKTDEDKGCCLETGELMNMGDNDKVIRVACEVRVV